MKNVFPLAVGLVAATLLSFVARAQGPTWQSAVAISQGRDNTSVIAATAAAANGDVYLAGSFQGRASFGNVTLTSAGSYDAFVAKWDHARGSFTWAQRAGGALDDRATAIAVTGASIYLTGHFQSLTLDMGSTQLTNAGQFQPDVFVAKINDNGTTGSFVWAQQAGGTEMDIPYAVAVSGPNVYIAGFFGSFFNDATSVFGATTLTTAGGSDMFVAKLTDAGGSASFGWARRAGGQDFDQANALAVRGSDVYVAGFTHNATLTLGSTVLTNAGPRGTADAFVAKLTDVGSFVWAHRAGGTNYDAVTALAVSDDAVYVAGYMGSATASFGSLNLTNATTSGTGDAFVAKLTDAGATSQFAWAQRFGGEGDDKASAMVAQGSNIYMAGGFEGPAATIGPITLTNAGQPQTADVFVAKLIDAGVAATCTWALSAGSAERDHGNSLLVNGTSIYVAGMVSQAATFGSQSMGNTAAESVGFLASLTDTNLTPTTAARSSFAFTLAPNPARNATTARLPAVSGATTATFTLRDALGRPVRVRTVALPSTGLRYELNLAGVSAGLYALQVAAGACRATQRLVVE